MPITINISGEAVKEVKQLVHDLADTMGRMADQDMPVDTAVSTIEKPAVQTYQPQSYVPQQQVAQAYQQQTVYTTPAQQPVQSVPTQPVAQVPPNQAPPVSTVPTTAVSYTMEQLGVAAGPLVDAGRGQELTAWLQQRGAQALTHLPKEQYGEFATFLRSLGAKI